MVVGGWGFGGLGSGGRSGGGGGGEGGGEEGGREERGRGRGEVSACPNEVLASLVVGQLLPILLECGLSDFGETPQGKHITDHRVFNDLSDC